MKTCGVHSVYPQSGLATHHPDWSVFEQDSFSGGEINEPAQTDALYLLGTLQDHRTGIWEY